MSSNGLQSFTFHIDQVAPTSPMRAAARAAAAGVTPGLAISSPEDAARVYLQESLANPDLPAFTIAPMAGSDVDFEVEATEDVALTGSKIVRFQQQFKHVPVYG